MSSLNIATRALTTNQAVLQVIGHNIANANTEGYTRQRAELNSVPGQRLGNGYFGKGVEIVTVAREGYDAFMTREANLTRASAGAERIRADYLKSVESLFPLGEGSLGKILNEALNSWADVAANPNETAARQVVLERFGALSARFRDTANRLEEVSLGARLKASERAGEVNRLAKAIADVNEAIARAAGTAGSPNDLLDQRDRLIAQLNEKIQVSTVPVGDGTVSVFVANSLPLVLGNRAAQLRTAPADLDGQRQIKLQFVSGTSSYDIPEDLLTGGQLKGLLQFINRDVTQTLADVGRMALAMADTINRQQRSGLNLDGQPGTDLLAYDTLQATAASTNTGSATITSVVQQGSSLKPRDYVLEFTNATQARIRRASDGWYWNGTDWQATSAPVVTVNNYTIEGLTLNVAGTAAAGDRFVLSPGAIALGSMRVALSRPAELAAANRVVLTAGNTNTGNATIEAISARIVSGTWTAPTLPATLTFVAPNQFTNSSGLTPSPVTYTPGQPMKLTYTSGANSVEFSITLRGQPAANDTFNINNTPSAGLAFNAGNAQAMLALRDSVVFDGSVKLSEGYVAAFSNVAARINEAQTKAEFAKAQADDAEQRRANSAGVNLDEEAARLLQFQQAYQASAKYLQTVQSVFDTLISTFR